MYLRRLCLILVGLLLTHTASAHVDTELLTKYKTAKKYYAASAYTAAKMALEPLMDVQERNDLSPYVLFYYALATYYNGEQELAEQTFTTLLEQFPGWAQREEVWYWLSQLRFEDQDYAGGLACLAKIENGGLAKPARKMKAYFLGQLDETATLQGLLRDHPKDADIAQVLFDKLAQQPLIRRDFELLDLLARNFDLVLKEYDLLQGLTSLKKESYNVAVFLPFFVNEVDYEAESSNAFVITLYQGIKAAVEALAEQGIKISLFAYDTKKDPATTAAILKQREVRHMDLIIGPLSASTTPLVTDFAKRYKINVFNPLSANAEVVGDNPFVFLSKPSLDTQARKAAELTLQDASPDAMSVGIIYGKSPTGTDAVPAHAYQQYIEGKTGQEVTLMLPLAPGEAQNFLHKLRGLAERDPEDEDYEDEEDIDLLDKLNSLTHIYVASENPLIAANVLGAVEMLKIKPLIIGHERWLTKGALTLDQLQRLRLRLIAPDYIDYEKEGVYNFRNHFYEQFAQYPDYFACKGYDMMLFLGDMLGQHGIYFQKYWQSHFCPGTIFGGAIYGTHHDNQYVPILQPKEGKLIICNQTTTDD